MYASPRHRHAAPARRAPDINQQRTHWRALVDAARAMAGRAIDTDGREAFEAAEFRATLRLAVPMPSARGDAAAEPIEAGFRAFAAAMLVAGADERRVAIAQALTAAADAVDRMLGDELAPYLNHTNRMLGERGD